MKTLPGIQRVYPLQQGQNDNVKIPSQELQIVYSKLWTKIDNKLLINIMFV